MTAGQKSRTADKTGFVFTGWHMLATMLAFFGVIITVNLTMAYNAVTSWSGLVVPNSYVASQQFNTRVAEARALAATGITGRLSISGSEIRYEVFHPEQGPIEADRLRLQFERPVGDKQDFSLDLQPTAPGLFVASHEVLPGHWIVHAEALKAGAPLLRHGERIAITQGSHHK